MSCVYDNTTPAVDECVECGAGLCGFCGYTGEASELRYCNECYQELTDAKHEAA